jgi:hypothetical protein
MFSRMSFVAGDATRLDDLVTYVRTVVKPATDELPGNHGLGMWINRDTGEALVMAAWRDEASMIASESAVLKLRDDGAGVIGGAATVERYELMMVDATEPHQVGNMLRLTHLSCPPSHLADNLTWASDAILPQLQAMPGYLSYAVFADRNTGAMVAGATYRDRASAVNAFAASAAVREGAVERGMTIEDVRHFEVAIVGIRAAATTIPAQRTIDLSAASATIT